MVTPRMTYILVWIPYPNNSPVPALSDLCSGHVGENMQYKSLRDYVSLGSIETKMIFYFLLMPLPVYCGACDDIPISLWAKYFREGFQRFCDDIISEPLRMIFTMPLKTPLRKFVLYGKADDPKVSIFKVANKFECRYMERLVTAMVKRIVAEKHDSLKKTCKMFRKKRNFLCLPHWEHSNYRGKRMTKPVLYCAFSKLGE